MIVLDTDTLIDWGRSGTSGTVSNYLSARTTHQWVIPSIALYEYLTFYDSQSRRRRERQRIENLTDDILPFDADAAQEAADIENLLESAGASLDTGDLLIAAIARDRGGILATRNKNDFDKTPIHQLMDVDIVDTP